MVQASKQWAVPYALWVVDKSHEFSSKLKQWEKHLSKKRSEISKPKMFDTSEPVAWAKGRIIYKAVFEIGVFKEITLLPCAISVALNLFLPWISNSCKLFTVVRIVVNCLCVGLMLYYCFVSMCLWENILERSRQNKEETKNSHKLDLNHIDQCCFSEVTLHDDRKNLL